MMQKTLVAGVIVLLCMPVSAAMDSEPERPAEEATSGGDDVAVFINGSLALIGDEDEIIGFKVTVINHREEEVSGYFTYAVPLFRESQFWQNTSFEVGPGMTYEFLAGFIYSFTFLKVTVKVDNITVTRMGIMVMGFTVFFTPAMQTGFAGSTSSPAAPGMAGTTGMRDCIPWS